MSNEVLAGRLCLSCYVVIDDAEHAEVGRISFREAVTITCVGLPKPTADAVYERLKREAVESNSANVAQSAAAVRPH